jgi:chromosome segregation protein
VRLKSIKIIGFKSFADKTILEFQEGITGIVGPNGCGKSNISDAFRWVFGEQSAKSMRGHKMQDVIFAGTTTRKGLNFAEVTITLSDVGGELPIDYEEVAVTRRLHRSGDSEYFINGQVVRLKDVQSLFLDSGVGKDAFSIFEQGKIDQVINFSPLERRYIFEEAAGILRFLQRKREALRKLEQADLNISRVKDIHHEVEKQIIVLEEQAEKARLYKEHKAQLEAFEKALFVAKWDALQEKSDLVGQKDEEKRKRNALLSAELEALEGILQEIKLQLLQSEKAFRTKSEDLFRTRSEKEIKSREKQTSHERIKELQSKEKRWQTELESIQEKRKARQSEQITLQKQQRDVEKDVTSLEKMAKAQREKIQLLDSEVSKLREQQQKAQQELMKLIQTENQIETELKQNSVRLENAQEKLAHIEEKQEQQQSQSERLSEQLEEKQEHWRDLSEALNERKEIFLKSEEDLKETLEAIQTAQKELNQLNQEVLERRARQNVLLRLREEMEGFSKGSKRLLQEASNSKSPFYKKIKGLYEYVAPKKGSEMAFAAMLRPYSQTLVVEEKKDFYEVVEFAKKNNLKDFSLFCPALLNLSLDALSSHFVSNSNIVKTLELAWQQLNKTPGMEVWIEEGALIDRHQVLFFISQGENNVFLREAELKSLETELQESETKLIHVQTALDQHYKRKEEIQFKRVEMDKTIRREEMSLAEVNFSLQRLKTDVEKIKYEAKQLSLDKQSLNQTVQQLKALLAELEKRYQEAKAHGQERQKLISSVNSELERENSLFRQQQLDLKEREAAYQKVAEENRRILHALNVIEVKELESQQQEKRLQQEIEDAHQQQQQFKDKGLVVEHDLEEVEKTLGKVSHECAEVEKEIQRKKTVIEKTEAKIIQIRNQLKQSESELSHLAVQRAQIESQGQTLITELQERYQLTLEEVRALGLSIEQSIEQTEKLVRAIRQQMESAGDVNMMSIEEFDKHKTRYEFLNQQIDDLNGSKQELIRIITELDEESRKIFRETFEQISANFKKNFKILFNGGEADLQFTETPDVLEAGIEIIAKPPGKQMRSINLLSGGEKCLTAMALLFAIFEVKSAPFCILDEIDAPLDDSNVERFVNVVKQFIDRCQFIIITHNKRTMAIADRLFGVSMEEKGVSKLLSIEFTGKESPELTLV